MNQVLTEISLKITKLIKFMGFQIFEIYRSFGYSNIEISEALLLVDNILSFRYFLSRYVLELIVK